MNVCCLNLCLPHAFVKLHASLCSRWWGTVRTKNKYSKCLSWQKNCVVCAFYTENCGTEAAIMLAMTGNPSLRAKVVPVRAFQLTLCVRCHPTAVNWDVEFFRFLFFVVILCILASHVHHVCHHYHHWVYQWERARARVKPKKIERTKPAQKSATSGFSAGADWTMGMTTKASNRKKY